MSVKKSFKQIGAAGRLTIGRLLILVFVAGLLVSSALVYFAFSSYLAGAVRTMAQADGERIAHLVYENLYSVMRKGSNRAELDDLVHHIQIRLPDYRVTIVRGEPVAREYGERLGLVQLRDEDSALARVLRTGEAYSGQHGEMLRYLLPVRAGGECLGCHTMARLGDVNGVIAVSVPLEMLERPITELAYPMMYLVLFLLFALILITFLILRSWVSQPIQELAGHVSEIFRARNYSHPLRVGKVWPSEVRSLGVNFNLLMRQVRRSQRRLLDVSLRDPLTGLFNRRHFDTVLERAVLDAEAGGRVFAVLLIDLDEFKPVNDRYGHAAGDALLMNVARALAGSVRQSEVVARIGGDEFAVLTFPESYELRQSLVERLRQAVAGCSLRLGKDQVAAGCSIGVAVFPESGRRAADLLLAADIAMYGDKQQRKQARSLS